MEENKTGFEIVPEVSEFANKLRTLFVDNMAMLQEHEVSFVIGIQMGCNLMTSTGGGPEAEARVLSNLHSQLPNLLSGAVMLVGEDDSEFLERIIGQAQAVINIKKGSDEDIPK